MTDVTLEDRKRLLEGLGDLQILYDKAVAIMDEADKVLGQVQYGSGPDPANRVLQSDLGYFLRGLERQVIADREVLNERRFALRNARTRMLQQIRRMGTCTT